MSDPTEDLRRLQQRLLNTDPVLDNRAAIEQEFGQAWGAEELTRDFEVTGFLAPYVVVRRKSDGVVGTLQFRHSPRFYFNFQADSRG